MESSASLFMGGRVIGLFGGSMRLLSACWTRFTSGPFDPDRKICMAVSSFPVAAEDELTPT
jgi:hypothetical protein